MIIYLDKQFGCHTTNDGTMREYETDFFDGKAEQFIEGYRLIPEGEIWTRSDGASFKGRMITPKVDFRHLERVQKQYEMDKEAAADMEEALSILLGGTE